MNPFIWIPGLVLLSVAQVYASTRFNSGSRPWGYALWLSSLVPIWIMVSHYSKNLMWDVLAYDLTVFFTWGVAAGFMTGAFPHYGTVQWVAVAMIAVGFVLLHVAH